MLIGWLIEKSAHRATCTSGFWGLEAKMEKISEMVAAQGLNLDSFKKFIESRKDQVTTRWGYFGTYCRNTLLCIGLFDDIIVVVAEDSQYEMSGSYASGIGHEDSVYAYDVDMTRRWSIDGLISYRDQFDPKKDRMGPTPKKFVSLRKECDSQVLKVIALMPDGTEREFFLKERKKK